MSTENFTKTYCGGGPDHLLVNVYDYASAPSGELVFIDLSNGGSSDGVEPFCDIDAFEARRMAQYILDQTAHLAEPKTVEPKTEAPNMYSDRFVKIFQYLNENLPNSVDFSNAALAQYALALTKD